MAVFSENSPKFFEKEREKRKMFTITPVGVQYIFITLLIIDLGLIVYFEIFRSGRRNATVQSNLQEPVANLPQDQKTKTSASEMTAEEKLYANSFNKWLYRANGIVFGLSIFMIALGKTWPSWERLSKLNWTTAGVTLLLLQVLYTLANIQSVNENQLGFFQFFGKFVKRVPPGLVYIPYLLCKLIVYPTTTIELDLPGPPEKIFYGDLVEDASGSVPDDKVAATRVRFAPSTDQDMTIEIGEGEKKRKIIIKKDDPYAELLVAGVETSYGFSIQDALLFYRKIKNIESAVSQMDDVTTGEVNAQLTILTAAEAQARILEVADKVKITLQNFVNDWGIKIEFVTIKPFVFSHKLNKAVNDVIVAGREKVSAIRRSEGEKEKLTNVGVGNANARYDFLAAEADGARELAEVIAGPGGEFAVGVKAIQAGLETAHAVIVPQDNIFGSVAGIAQLLKNLPPVAQPDKTSLTSIPQGTEPSVQSLTETQNPQPRTSRYGGRKGREEKK